MKKIPGLFALVLLLTATAFTASAQEEETPAAAVQKAAPRWVSDKGYWMIESNIHQPRHSCVYFYNNNNELVHKETIDGVKLSVNRNRTKLKLKKALEAVVDAWTAGQSPDSSRQIVAALFKK